VVGTGATGKAIARALVAIGHRVTGLSRSGRPDDAFDVVLPLADARALTGSHADVLVLALPHTAQTAGLITPEFLQAFEGVHLINIGRGSAIRDGIRPTSAVAQDRGY
jgi:glyoxylate/hydroxypyruvate reductase A